MEHYEPRAYDQGRISNLGDRPEFLYALRQSMAVEHSRIMGALRRRYTNFLVYVGGSAPSSLPKLEALVNSAEHPQPPDLYPPPRELNNRGSFGWALSRFWDSKVPTLQEARAWILIFFSVDWAASSILICPALGDIIEFRVKWVRA